MLTDTLIPTADIETKSTDTAPAQPLRARRYRSRRTTADRVREALLILADGRASLLTHEEKAWASITFSGTRHEVMLDFDGREACEAGEKFIANLSEHEFRIPGQLVAEATVREVDHRFGGEDERMVVTAVLLLLEEF
ncbi:hypothetical protein [Erythrobacter sp. THAF29]|uniref:hypothetical protein n=1 Tax=Erythrobacter sp. THAF29 TaxID=2587851 RepID=UPI0012687F6A|nr:hypothetical protein [Erythrobacter sp. THAF29]QFT78362.1 hypothetical protein FIU90_12500 [Erythrobacter sp. THAF29]